MISFRLMVMHHQAGVKRVEVNYSAEKVVSEDPKPLTFAGFDQLMLELWRLTSIWVSG